jgi:hypothetical protein
LRRSSFNVAVLLPSKVFYLVRPRLSAGSWDIIKTSVRPYEGAYVIEGPFSEYRFACAALVAKLKAEKISG